MAFSFENNSSMMGAPAGGVGGLTQGNDLEVIQTEGLGFLSVAGDAKVQLTSKWSPPPAPTASLISIASRKGLVAAAGPDAIHIATTESVRKAFEGEKVGDSEVRSFAPQAKVPLPIRVSQLAFTADEQYLILSAESGGGLAVYEVQALIQGSTQSAFEISTNGETLRALAPNPMPELAGYCAIVTDKGNLLMANFAERKLISGPNGPALRSQASCVSWSTKGKQLVVGVADGSIYQMTPEGVEKAHIPKPPSLGDYHVASLAWIENNVFLAVYNATNGQDPSAFNVITRQQPPNGTATFTFQKLTNPVEPFMMEKPPHHTFLRLKDFPPNLTDMLLVASTANEGIGILTRSKAPLTQDKPADAITNVFTTTELADDSKRAQMPMSEDLTDTYPIGAALDLSSKDKVYKPIPTDEMDMSPGPLPGLWVLNNEGVLASWWVVYNESVRSGTTYPGIVAGGSPAQTSQSATPAALSGSAFGAPASGAPAFGTPSAPAPAFGTPSAPAPAFGGSSALGAKPSPWATGSTAAATPAFGSTAFGGKPATAAPAFGTPSFGKPATPAFGQSTMPGMGLGPKVSPWAAGSAGTAGTAFGQPGLPAAGATPGKVFGSGAATSGTSGGFASFANKGGFGGLASASTGSSIFDSKPAAPLVPEASMDTDTVFRPAATAKTDKPAFAASPFVLGTTFKAEPTSAADNEKPKETAGSSLFGSGFGHSLEDASKKSPAPESKYEEMDLATPAPEEKSKSVFSSLAGPTTPISTAAPSKLFQTAGPATGPGVFGSKPPAAGSSSNIFGAPKDTSNIFGAPKPATNLFGASKPATSNIFGTPKIKQEDEDKENLSKIPEAPLPPDSTSKAAFSLSSSDSDSGNSPVTAAKAPEAASLPPSKATSQGTSKSPTPKQPEAAPLPPDFISTKPKPATKDVKASAPEAAPLPSDFFAKPAPKSAPAVPAVPESPAESELSEGEVDEEDELDEGEEEEDEASEAASEGSGIDVTKDLSPTVGGFGSRTPGITPHGSFDGGMTGSAFSTISRSEAIQGRPLFGEVGKSAPMFAKPAPHSPRSPSPMRNTQRSSILRATQDTPRSHSAPIVANQLLGRKSVHITSSPSFAASQRQREIDPNVKAQRKARQKEAEEQALVDPEDEGIQQILRAPVEPTLKLHEFIAVDVKKHEPKTGEEVPSACESVLRDINRMIDNLGLNSRSLQSYILGHTVMRKDGGRDAEDLAEPDDWVLVEAEDLGKVMRNELARDLEDGRIKDVSGIEEVIQGIKKDLNKLRAREEDMRKIISSRVDPDQVSVAKSLPLSAEQAAQQNELRRSFATFSKLLAEAEEALTILKAKIASAGGATGRAPVPTAEAIIRTINKMTAMAEKRSGDIDVLENQMRRLRLGSVGPSTPGPVPRSREGSPFVTPQRRSIMTPERGSVRDSPFASSIMSHSGLRVNGTPTPRKRLANFTEDEKKAIRQKEVKRKSTLQLLKSALERNGPNVSRLRDDD
ncbi:putative nucleoporin [Cladorrhinum samala]|uniref:Nucleoporin n=1 Tax=Cladorrhinum samala TaxID=585594 RepID=A0AAV9HXV2_9PEZI|nr:putative nucleoporin [Cladorrhinum samala]